MNKAALHHWDLGVRYWRYKESGTDGFSSAGEWICSVYQPRARMLLTRSPTYQVHDQEEFRRRVWSESNNPEAFIKAFTEYFRDHHQDLDEFANRCLDDALVASDQAQTILLLLRGVEKGDEQKRKHKLEERRAKGRTGRPISTSDDLHLIDCCEDIRINGIRSGVPVRVGGGLVRIALKSAEALPANLQQLDLASLYDRFRKRPAIDQYLGALRTDFFYQSPFDGENP